MNDSTRIVLLLDKIVHISNELKSLLLHHLVLKAKNGMFAHIARQMTCWFSTYNRLSLLNICPQLRLLLLKSVLLSAKDKLFSVGEGNGWSLHAWLLLGLAEKLKSCGKFLWWKVCSKCENSMFIRLFTHFISAWRVVLFCIYLFSSFQL